MRPDDRDLDEDSCPASRGSPFLSAVQMPERLPVLGAAAVLIGAAVTASLLPAARASRVDVLQALRSE